MSHAYSAIPSSTGKEPTALGPGVNAGSPLLEPTRTIGDVGEYGDEDGEVDDLDLDKHAGGTASVFSCVSK